MEKQITCEIYPLLDTEGKLINDIDTDQIFHNKYLSIVDIEKMAPYALDNLEGYEDFSKKAKAGMIVLAGENFGSGSSRQQAVDCFRALKMSGVAAFSYGAIYKRNAINSGFPLIEIENLDLSSYSNGNLYTFDLETGKITLDGKEVGTFRKFSAVQNEIIKNNGLLNCI